MLAESLKTIRMKLTYLMRDISNQVDEGADQLSKGVPTLSQRTAEQPASVDGLVANVTRITSQIKDSAVRCQDASELGDRANGYASEADIKMVQLTDATKYIDQKCCPNRSKL